MDESLQSAKDARASQDYNYFTRLLFNVAVGLILLQSLILFRAYPITGIYKLAELLGTIFAETCFLYFVSLLLRVTVFRRVMDAKSISITFTLFVFSILYSSGIWQYWTVPVVATTYKEITLLKAEVMDESVLFYSLKAIFALFV
jgi:hypothetical protein